MGEFSAVKKALDREGRLVPAMEYAAIGGEKWEPLRALWLSLPEHPGLIEAIGSSDDSLVLRYAAITSNYWFAAEVAHELASFGAQLAWIYRTICAAVDDAELGRLLQRSMSSNSCASASSASKVGRTGGWRRRSSAPGRAAINERSFT
jgi:hypothetical protein